MIIKALQSRALRKKTTPRIAIGSILHKKVQTHPQLTIRMQRIRGPFVLMTFISMTTVSICLERLFVL